MCVVRVTARGEQKKTDNVLFGLAANMGADINAKKFQKGAQRTL